MEERTNHSEAPLQATHDHHVRQGARDLEPLRCRWLLRSLLAWAVLLGPVVVFVSLCRLPDAPDWTERFDWRFGAAWAIAVVVCFWYSHSAGKALHKAFAAWRSQAAGLLDPEAYYATDRGFEAKDFDRAGVNQAYYNQFSSWDLLAVGDVHASALSVRHQYTETYTTTESYTDSQGNSQTRQVQRTRTVVVPIFNGVLIAMPAPLPQPAWVLLTAKGCRPKELDDMAVACPPIAENYDIGTSDQFAGHRTLAPQLLDSLWSYRRHFKEQPLYSYRDGLLYIAIPGHYLPLGGRLGRLRSVTTDMLGHVLADFGRSIALLKTTATALQAS